MEGELKSTNSEQTTRREQNRRKEITTKISSEEERKKEKETPNEKRGLRSEERSRRSGRGLVVLVAISAVLGWRVFETD